MSENDTARGLIVGPDGSVKDFTYTGYESLRAAVGGYIECITTAIWAESGERYDIWGNEESRINGSLNSEVARKIVSHMSGQPLSNVLTLHGNMVLLGSNPEGDCVDLPETAFEFFKEFSMLEVEAEAEQGKRDEPFSRVVVLEDTPFGEVPRAEHMKWAKDRAYEYLDKGDRPGALASFVSDLEKHSKTDMMAVMVGMYALQVNEDIETTRRFIEGFN
jgi:hypothetical protein